MKKKDFMNVLLAIACLVFLWTVFTPQGSAWSVQLMKTRPVLFYTVVISIAGVFVSWLFSKIGIKTGRVK